MILGEWQAELATKTGPMRTYVYAPTDKSRYPGVVLFSEIFQRTGPISRMAAMIAGHGFVVAVPEIFHELEPAGTVLAYDQAGADAGNRHKVAKTVASYDDDARAAVDWLSGSDRCTGKIGSMGVCIGGHLALRCALDRRVLAAACFYATDVHTGTLGRGGDDTLARAGDVRGELTMVWGRQDPHIPDAGRAKIEARLAEANVRFNWHEVNAAHAFMRDEGPRYDPALALFGYRLAIDALSRMAPSGEV